MADPAYAAEVERRLGTPFAQVRDTLVELFGCEWDEVEVFIETRVTKKGFTHADVVCDLMGKTANKATVQQRVKRAAIRWIGKPWRERDNPWDKHKTRLPGPPPPTDLDPADLDEWTPRRRG